MVAAYAGGQVETIGRSRAGRSGSGGYVDVCGGDKQWLHGPLTLVELRERVGRDGIIARPEGSGREASRETSMVSWRVFQNQAFGSFDIFECEGVDAI
mgnify:CR=1 FL=1